MSEPKLRELVDSLPGDDLSDAIRKKVTEVEHNFLELAKQHKQLQHDLKMANRDKNEALAAKQAIHREKEALRVKAEETLAGFKENIETLRKAKNKPTSHTVVWVYDTELMTKGFDDREKAYDFWHAIGDVPKAICEARLANASGTDQANVAKFLNMQHEKLTSTMAALGFEQEVVIPDEVEDTLRETRLFLTRSLQNIEHPSPKHLQLIERLNEMLIDEDEHIPDFDDDGPNYELDQLADLEADSFLEEDDISEDERRELLEGKE